MLEMVLRVVSVMAIGNVGGRTWVNEAGNRAVLKHG